MSGMLFGLTMSLNASGAAPAGGFFECRRVDAWRGENPVCVPTKSIFVSGDADQSVEKSLEQVHSVNLVLVRSIECAAFSHVQSSATGSLLRCRGSPDEPLVLANKKSWIDVQPIRKTALDEAHSRPLWSVL